VGTLTSRQSRRALPRTNAVVVVFHDRIETPRTIWSRLLCGVDGVKRIPLVLEKDPIEYLKHRRQP
jgi:hypothetical protein